MKAQGLARLGKDAEIRYLPNGDAVANLALAFTYGKKYESGKRPTQWVDATLWGKRAESLAQYLTKGTQVVAYLENVRIETYEGKNGQGSKLAASVADLELIAGSAPQQAKAPAPAPKPAPKPSTGSGFDDMDSDIPF
ncbi:MAG: single-stranded DNA-binding protein [Hyphomicrobium sp.]|jgi:single-strand DNA-binding protein